MIRLIAAIAGAALVLAVWLSVMRTVLTPRERSSRLARWALRVVATVSLAIARRLPWRAGEHLMDFCAPVTLFLMAGCWLVATTVGFDLLAWSVWGMSLRPAAIASFLLLRSTEAPLLAVAWLWTTLLLLAAFTMHLVRFTDAYSRRERLVAKLAGQATRAPDAEAVLADYLRTGSRDHLDSLFAEWAGWTADIRATHVGYPALTFSRPSGSLCWIKAAVIVLDAAALTQAVAPNWAPPHTRTLITIGTRCLPQLAAQIGIVLPTATVSLQGREENGFADTMRLAVDAGLPAERDQSLAWAAFQELRTQYAPHATAITTRLLYHRYDIEALNGAAHNAGHR